MTPPARPVRAEATFGQWTVRRAGLVISRTEAKPAGIRAAECECSCGTVRVVRVDRLFSGESKSCGHGRGRRGKPRPAPPSPEPTMPRRIAGWAAGQAAGRLFSAAEVAAGLGLETAVAQSHLSRAVASGLVVRWWPGAFSLPGAGPFTRPAAVAADEARILGFIASDGGATWAELRDALGLPAGALSPQLERLADAGRVVWELEPTGRTRRFYLLPGQQPGEIITGEPCASAGRVSDRTRLQQRRTCGPAYPRPFTGG